MLAPWMWTSVVLAFVALALLLNPRWRTSPMGLVAACLCTFAALWIDKGLGMVITGFVPNPLGEVIEYWPTLPELLISAGIYAIGALILTVLYKIAVSVREALQG